MEGDVGMENPHSSPQGHEVPGEASWAVRALRTPEGWWGDPAIMEVIEAKLHTPPVSRIVWV